MKTKSFYLGLTLLGFTMWSCTSQSDVTNKSLKTSINASAQDLTSAMTAITTSPGYSVLSTQGPASAPSLVKSSVDASSSNPGFIYVPIDSIQLSQVAGIYDYKAAKSLKWRADLFNFFTKTGTSSDFVVRLPESKVKNARSLFTFAAADTTLQNNYVIDVSKYSFSFGRYFWNYNLASSITVSNVSVGALSVQSSRNKTNGQNFLSDFVFANGYDAKMKYSTGDTILSVYSISKGGTTLFEEKFTAVKSDTASHHRERQYSLTIGNVQIVRTPTHGNNGLDSAKVYVAGVLQTKATVKFVDNANVTEDMEMSVIGHSRDLQITFDDGTVTTVSQLLGTTITDIRTLFTSLRQVYFATNVVDRLAWDILMNKMNI